jgi:hypothetical protein
MNPTNIKHIEFCSLVSKGENQDKAYRVTIGSKEVTDAVCRVKGSQLSSKYAEYISNLKKQDADMVLQAKSDETVKKALNNVLSTIEVDAYLSNGIKKGDIRAIDIYYKRFGVYPTIKTETELIVTDKVKGKLPDGTEFEL